MRERGLGSIVGMIMGSVALKVMHVVDVPILLVKWAPDYAGLPRSLAITMEINGQNSMIIASVVMLPTSQFENITVTLPCEPSMAWRNEFSAALPRTSASTSGASG